MGIKKMLQKRLNLLSKTTKNIRFCSQRTPQELFGPHKSQVPKFDPIEFSPFKFSTEKEKYFAGYTYPELYGKKVLYNHSPLVRKEMFKDGVLFIVWILIAGMIAENSRRIIWE